MSNKPESVVESPLEKGVDAKRTGAVKTRRVLYLWKIQRNHKITSAVLGKLFDKPGKYLRDILSGHTGISDERRRKIDAFLRFIKVPAAEIERAWDWTKAPANERRHPTDKLRLQRLYKQVETFNKQYKPTAEKPDNSSVDPLDMEVLVFERTMMPVSACAFFEFTDSEGTACDPFWAERKDPEHCPPYQYPGYVNAFEAMLQAAKQRAMFALVAPPASGKTYLLERAKVELKERGYLLCEPRLLTKSKLSEGDMLNAILAEVASDPGIRPRHRIADRTDQIFQMLTVDGKGMKKVALIVDEAQEMVPLALRVLKRLHDWRYGVYDNLLSIFLIGHPLLKSNLLDNMMVQETGRRTVIHELPPLDNIFKFLDWRFHTVLGKSINSQDLFTPEGAALFNKLLHKEDQARPLAVCSFAARLFTCAASLEEKQISDHVISEVAAGWRPE